MFSSISRCGWSASGSPSSLARAMRAASAVDERGERLGLRQVGLPVGDPNLDGREREVRPDAPPELRVLGDGARLVEEANVVLVLLPRRERVRHAAAREEAREDLRARRVETGVDALVERGARREREDLRQQVPQPVRDRDRPVCAADADVDVEAEGVVAPDDVSQQLVVPAVVRRVDDPLLLPRRPRMRAGRAERDSERVDDGLQLRAALRHRGGDVGERLAAPGLDLDLRRDQLPDDVRLERRSLRSCLNLLEAVDEVERRRVEEGELLLHRDREVGAASRSPRARRRGAPRSRAVCSSPMRGG